MVKTTKGHTQHWTKSSTRILREDYMTSKILMKLTGGPGKIYSVIERVFDTVDDAAEYLAEIGRIDGIKDTSKNGQIATLGNGWTISCNYDLREVVKKIPPDKELWDWFPFDLQKKMRKSEFRSTYKAPEAPTLTPSPAKKLSGKTIKLQDLTNDGRTARVILRDLVRKNKITKNGRWEWEEGSPDLEIVRAAINKGAKK